MSGPFKMKYKGSSFPFKSSPAKDVKGLKYTPPKSKELTITKHAGLIPGRGTGKKLSEILPTGVHGGGEITYRPTKKITLRGGVGGSVSKHGSTTDIKASLQKKFKGGKFNIGIGKRKGDKPVYTAGISLNI